MKNVLLTFLLMVYFLSNSFGQNDTAFLDKDGKECKRNSAVYYRLIKKENGSFVVTDYFINNNNLQMHAVCSQINPVIKNGNCSYFDKYGKLYLKSQYKNDTLNGLETLYRENGSIYSTSNYLNGKLDGWIISYKKDEKKHYEEEYRLGRKTGSQRLYFQSGQLQGEFIWVKKRVNGYKIWYYENGEIQSKVTFVNGKRHREIRAGKILK